MRKPLLWAAATVLTAAGCGGSNSSVKTGGETKAIGASTQQPGEELRIPKVDETLCDATGKKVETYDLNHDGKPDVWKLMKEKNEKGTTVEILTCEQVDLDHDGKKDYVVQYDDSGAIVVEDYDMDFDGKFDARIHYDKKTGLKYLVERQSQFASAPDLWEKYDKDGKLDTVIRDRNGDGRPDLWEQYRNGQLERILYDEDGDGKVDRVDDSKTAQQ